MASIRENTGAKEASWASFALFAAAFCLYAGTSSPTIGWLDSPEFVAQAVSLGVAHSPGHPLPALLGRLATFVPVGDLVWRVNLMSSLCAAGAVTLLFACARQLLAMVSPTISGRSQQVLALIFASVAGLSWALWSNAVRAEVYALQALLSAGALLALLQYAQNKRPRALLLAAFFLALGLANHHLMALMILLPAAVFVLGTSARPSARLSGWAAGVGVLALTSLAYLPIRSLAHPEVNFGAPHTLGRFFWTLRGAAFTKSAHADHASTPMMDAIQILVGLADALSLPGLLLAIVGIVHLLAATRTRGLGAMLLGIIVLCAGARVLLGFDPVTPDHHAYLLPAIFTLFLLSLVGIASLCERALQAKRPLPKAPALACLALSLLIPIQLAANYGQTNQADSWASEDLAHWESQSLPPNSLVLIAYFQTTFRQWAIRAVEGDRPDLTLLDRSFLTYPGTAEEAKLHSPELSELIDAPLKAGVPSPIALLNKAAGQRPLLVQLHINVDPALAAAVTPAGAYAQYSTDDRARLTTLDMQARAALATLLQDAGVPERDDAKRALLWHDAMRLDQYCHMRELGPAAQVYADAKALVPEDLMLAQMATACGIAP